MLFLHQERLTVRAIPGCAALLERLILCDLFAD
jgi:hypothetical protein